MNVTWPTAIPSLHRSVCTEHHAEMNTGLYGISLNSFRSPVAQRKALSRFSTVHTTTGNQWCNQVKQNGLMTERCLRVESWKQGRDWRSSTFNKLC